MEWEVEDEEPQTKFEVQRSANGSSFQTIHIKNGNQGIHYSYVDASPLQGKSFYRLKMMEPGSEKYSPIVAIKDQATPFIIKTVVATASEIKISIETDVTTESGIQIIASNGAVVYSGRHRFSAPRGEIILPLQFLPSGQYFVRIQHSSFNDTRAFYKP